MKKITLLLLCAAMLAPAAGCQNKNTSGKVSLSVGLWPDGTNKESLQIATERKEKFESLNQDIEIVPDTYAFDTKTFTIKASAGQLPNLYVTYFTEIDKNIKNAYAKDITDIFKEYGYDKDLNPLILDKCMDENGHVFALPQSVYAIGLHINKALFEEAGLVNEDGSLKYPQTYDEVAEFSKTIREKTGKAGFVFPTTNNCGGWHFLNIAWAYGTEFVKQDETGKWQAAFDTQATRDALQWISDMKWKYNAFPDDKVLDLEGIYKQFAVGNAAMMLGAPPQTTLVTKYGMNIDDIVAAKMPAGPKGRFSQMGGGVYMFSPNSTDEQVRAGFRWLEFRGYTPKLDEESEKGMIEEYELKKSDNEIILDKDQFSLWVSGERAEKENEVRKQYTNVKPENYENYYDFSDVTINPEPPVCAQELYAIFDSCIQEIFSNENADIDKLVTDAAKDFQTNHLDKLDS